MTPSGRDPAACPSDETVLGFLEGGLSGALAERVDHHLDGCLECRRLVRELARTSLLLMPSDDGITTVPMGPPSEIRGVALAPVEVDGFALGDEIARGGMGRVVAADDLQLGRRVAVKHLLPGRGELRARFAREVRITARLQHPAVVPIYQAGQLPSGEPYYAMRLVSGRSLDKVVAEAKELRGRMALLPHALAVADALAYAHRHRVLHRDLKPANVLIGELGETVVIDWGLAKDLAAADSDPDDAGEGPTLADDQTAAGAVIGTPAYMAPEQARGEEVDERADVWALGALVYHLLAGCPPYDGVPASSRMTRVRAGAPPPLADRVPDAPADLVALVQKAMAPDPADRYPTAVELAEDLRAFQAGRLVGAHRYSAWERVGRLVARNRAAVAVAIAALALLLATAGAAVLRVVSERDRAQAQRAAAESLVEFMLFDLHDRLAQVGRLELLEGVGDGIAAYYRSVAAPDADAREKQARAFSILGAAARAKGDLGAARAHREQALALRRWVLVRAPGDVGALIDDGRVRMELGGITEGQGDLRDAERHYRDARAVGERIAALAAADPSGPEIVGGADLALGDLARDSGDLDGATASYGAAIAAARTMALLSPPGAWLAMQASAAAHERLGSVAYRRRDTAGARAAFLSALAQQTAATAAEPADLGRQRELAATLGELGDVDLLDGKLADASRHYEACRALIEPLVERDPRNVQWGRDLYSAYLRISDAATDAGEQLRAVEAGNAALAIATRLSARDPGNASFLHAVASAHNRLGFLAERSGRFDDALEHYRGTLALLTALSGAHPEQREWRRDVAASWINVGDAERGRGRHADAAAAYRRGVAMLDDLGAQSPGNVRWLVHRTMAHGRLGTTLAHVPGAELEARLHIDLAAVALAALAAGGKLAQSDLAYLREMNAERARLGEGRR